LSDNDRILFSKRIKYFWHPSALGFVSLNPARFATPI
jgi:hypothetical protein